jgi:hypothetical protein
MRLRRLKRRYIAILANRYNPPCHAIHTMMLAKPHEYEV